jgi:hypothetical protein
MADADALWGWVVIMLLAMAAAVTAAQDAPFQPIPLDQAKIPHLLFFCASKSPKKEVYALEVEHDSGGDLIRIGRTPGRSDLLFEQPASGATMKNTPDVLYATLSGNDPTEHSQADVMFTVKKDGSDISAEFDLKTATVSYSATCTRVPLPPGLERGE